MCSKQANCVSCHKKTYYQKPTHLFRLTTSKVTNCHPVISVAVMYNLSENTFNNLTTHRQPIPNILKFCLNYLFNITLIIATLIQSPDNTTALSTSIKCNSSIQEWVPSSLGNSLYVSAVFYFAGGCYFFSPGRIHLHKFLEALLTG